MNKKILVVAFFFPPLGGGGVFRTAKFVKYLPKYGWNPLVLTSKSWNYWAYDSSLFRELSNDLKVYRTRIIEPHFFMDRLRSLGLSRLSGWINNLVFYPDDRIGWLPFAYMEGLKLIKREHPKVIFTSSAPLTSHLIGYGLKRKTGIRWVADLRDEWTVPWRKKYSLLKRFDEFVGKKVLQSADKVITVSSIISEEIKSNMSVDNDKIEIIVNGYDQEDIDAIQPKPIPEKFIVTNAGKYYGKINPNNFLVALSSLIAKNIIDPREVEVRFVGSNADSSLVKKLGLNEVVSYWGYLPHLQALEKVSESAINLLVVDRVAAYSGKVFEYLALARPILALVPPRGVVAKLINECRGGVVVDPDDVPEIERSLGNYYRDWKEGNLRINPNRDVIKLYERKLLTSQLARVLDGLI